MNQDLYDSGGQRLYVTPRERNRFLNVVEHFPAAERTFCKTLALTGCRISEGLQLIPPRIDHDGRLLVFETLKKRRRGVFRSVPVPPTFITELQTLARQGDNSCARLWPWGRTKGYHIVKHAMTEAKIVGPHAVPKGLRHGFAIHALAANIPLTLIQKWMGHSSIEITAIYLQVAGEEEYKIARRMWPMPHNR